MATFDGEGTFRPKWKPKITLKEAIIRVLQEAGPGGLTVKELVQRIKKKKWWVWENDERGYDSVSAACNYPSYRDVFVRVAPGTYALRALQDDDFTPYVYEEPKTVKEAIIRVLQEAGPGGLHVKEMVQRIKKKKWWDWKNDEAGSMSVSGMCGSPIYRDVFAHVAPGTFALRALQDDDLTPYVYEEPKTVKEAIIRVLQEAGPGGLHVKELAQRIKKKKWWDWKDDEAGYDSVSGTCRVTIYRDVFAQVAPGTFALWALQDDDFTPYEKPMTLKEAIIRVLQEAGPGGLTLRQIVQRIKKKKWWDWKDDEAGYNSVSNTCCKPSNGDVFVHVAPGTWALWALQDDDFTPYVKPMTLKEAIIRVLQEAGPGGLTLKEIVQRIKEEELWDWKNDEASYNLVSDTCSVPRNRDVFVKHSPGVYALRSLQEGEGEGEGSSKALAKEKADDDAERIPSESIKRTREAASGSGGESNQITTKKKKQVVEEPQSDAVPVEDRRLLLYTDEQKAAADAFFERALERARAERAAERQRAIEKERSSERGKEERSSSDCTVITLSVDCPAPKLKAIAGTENKRDGISLNEAKKKKIFTEERVEEPQSKAMPVADRRLPSYIVEQLDRGSSYLQQALDLLQ